MATDKFDLTTPFPDVFPETWADAIGDRDFMAFRNLDHFRHVVSQLKQKDDNKCGITYDKALQKMLAGESEFPKKEQESIRNLVRSKLHKRGLITEEIYEAFRYVTDGTTVDVDIGKYANGEPDCVIAPARAYVDFFYELYISISYPYYVENSKIRENCAKLLATVEELERQHIFIKISLILPIDGVKSSGGNFFSAIPLFSHKDYKSVDTMSSIINDRLLRKFYFAVLEDLYKDDLDYFYGTAVTLEDCMNLGDDFNEIEFFEEVVKKAMGD